MVRRDAVTVWVPSSSANLGPGFDVLSIALREPSLRVSLSLTDGDNIKLVLKGKYGEILKTDPEVHSGRKALRKLMDKYGIDEGLEMVVYVDIPPRKGLGLSGAEAAGAVVAANELLSLALSKDELVHYASYGEPEGHLDNVSASVCGGFNIVVKDYVSGMPRVYNFRPPPDLGTVVIVPNVEKKSTEETRKAVPTFVHRGDVVGNVSRVAAISVGFVTGDVDCILRNIAWDTVVEKARADSQVYGIGIDWRFLEEEKLYLFKKYGIAETISGAGPSRILWYSISRHSQTIDEALGYVVDRIRELGYDVEAIFKTYPSRIGAYRLLE
ncbi:MAG: hypothetical protein RMJ14_02000 [Nitrososphaerota archaeon]|nr:hypothetical protein [Aigarchaeota archaeon]MDW8076395.1 hypothetical protein [Nitrososphaerota archaeon]